MLLLSVPKTMRSLLFGASDMPAAEREGAGLLSRTDRRITYVPFLVRTPTFEEARMVHSRCSSIIFTLSGQTETPKETGASAEKGSKAGSSGTSGSGLVVNELDEALRELSREEEVYFAREREEQRQTKLLKAARRAGKEEKERKNAKKRQQGELSSALRLQVSTRYIVIREVFSMHGWGMVRH